MSSEPFRFCAQDTVSSKNDRSMVGFVDRSFGDIDTHEPRPQQDYDYDISRHEDIPVEKFNEFLKTGVPPRGTALVAWQTEPKAELVPEAQLELLDRALFVGDVVKKSSQSAMSGTVIATKAVCTLFPGNALEASQHLESGSTESLLLHGIPSEELWHVHEYQEGALVIYEDWVGRIEGLYDEVAIRLSNNSVVVVEDSDELDPDDKIVDRLSVRDIVVTKKGNLRRGRWKYGAFDPNIKPRGKVVEMRTTNIDVQWIARRFGKLGNEPEPPPFLGLDELESANIFIYDASRNAPDSLPVSSNGQTSYHEVDITVGDRVRFKDLAGAVIKYDGTRTLENGVSQGRLRTIPRGETLGYDMNVFVVMQTHTLVTVLWQDLTIEQALSSELIPDPDVEDDDDVWPGEIICTKERAASENESEINWAFKPAKVGVVQTVKPRDRLATVRWFKDPDIMFLGDDLIPPSFTGELSESVEDVSLYDIRSTPSLTRRRGDFVLIHPSSEIAAIDGRRLSDVGPISGPTWFGEVIDLGLDGKTTIRLGASKPVFDVKVAAECVTLCYSSDMDPSDLGFMEELDGDSIDDSMDSDDDSILDFDSADFRQIWVEYDDGHDEEASGNVNDEDWSTEEDDDDESMPDFLPEDVDTLKTTPEAQPGHERADDGTVKDTFVSAESELLRSNAPLTNLLNTAESGVSNSNAPPHSSPKLLTLESISPFLVLDSPVPQDHHFLRSSAPSILSRQIIKEHKILRSALPPGIFVRTWESRLDLLRVLMIGPSDTPYEYAPFLIDLHLGATFPSSPPAAYFHSWSNHMGPVNPNLYEDGKICLSLLGTWHGDERNENWSPTKSTLLQVLVSLMGLVLVKEPYYNEAGYDVHRDTPETKLQSSLYTERAYFRARSFIVHALTNPIHPFVEELNYMYRSNAEGAPKLLDKAIDAAKDIINKSEVARDEEERDGLRRISKGAAIALKRQVQKLEEVKLSTPDVE